MEPNAIRVWTAPENRVTAIPYRNVFFFQQYKRAAVDAGITLAAVRHEALLQWHPVTGYLGEQNIKRLTHGMAIGPKIKEGFCEACALGKQHAQPHRNPVQPGDWPMELIHCDLIGSIQEYEVYYL